MLLEGPSKDILRTSTNAFPQNIDLRRPLCLRLGGAQDVTWGYLLDGSTELSCGFFRKKHRKKALVSS